MRGRLSGKAEGKWKRGDEGERRGVCPV